MPSRPSRIIWRDADEERLKEAVRAYNKKRSRLINKNPELIDVLPDRLSRAEYKKKIQNRADFNKFVNSAERFMKPDATKIIENEVGLKITKYERKEIGIKLGIINRRRASMTEKYGNMDVVNQGVPTGMKRKEMGSMRMVALKPKKVNFNTLTKQNHKSFIESLNKQSMSNYATKADAQWKANYITSLRHTLPPKYKYLITVLKNTPLDKFIDTMYRDQNASTEFNYSTEAIEMKAKVLAEIWIDS
jgi:hypothetical protein